MTNVVGMVESARKAKAPIVGIPIPGQRPFCVKRDLLVNSLKGMTVIDAAIQLPLTRGDIPVMTVYASGPRVKGVRKFYPVSLYDCRRSLAAWTATQRRNTITLPTPVRLDKYDKQIAKLQKQLDKMGKVEPPSCALLYERKYSDQAGGYWRESGVEWGKWKREARLRNQLWHLANKTKPQMITTQLYKDARELKVSVRTWSDVTERERECKHITNLFDYLKRFHEFCGLTEKPRCFEPQEWRVKSADWDYADFGPDHYADWLEEVRARKELLSQIEGLRVMQTEAKERKAA